MIKVYGDKQITLTGKHNQSEKVLISNIYISDVGRAPEIGYDALYDATTGHDLNDSLANLYQDEIDQACQQVVSKNRPKQIVSDAAIKANAGR